ncbi:hypothetical protein SAMN02745857_01811 [Andreprevotia lacus DSM 23236]|jgi:hypothetical protein|uniref:Uncharacterized protein n=1 Tax=Andreprevotia lacus DSM 23236 TaxID=1121001 RepID=A0A1W1XL67_9NEIS|nr:hypothetical protein SAMN02745857_01811 [Andreprevotia lacus DSM 23236]
MVMIVKDLCVDLKSLDFGCAGSTPARGTTKNDAGTAMPPRFFLPGLCSAFLRLFRILTEKRIGGTG